MKTARREEERRVESRRGFGYILAFSVLTVALGFSALTIYKMYRQQDVYRIQLENIYEKSFYELSDNMDNLEVKLSKLMVASSSPEILRYLNDVTKQTDTTSASLSSLPVTVNTVEKTSKFVNQLGDFCKSLSDKVSKGGTITEAEKKQIEDLYDFSATLRKELAKMSVMVSNGYRFMDSDTMNASGGFDQLLNDSFTEIENGSVEYPSLIYDGPFSDSLMNAQPKGLPAEEATQEQAAELLNGYLADFKITEVKFENTTEGKIFTYNYNVTTEKGSYFAQVTKLGGKLFLLDNSRAMDNFELEVKECVTIAEAFVKSLGIEGMEAVWQSDYNGYVYVNLAAVVNDIVYYPDLIKVVVARDNGEVLGYEARGYYTNHVTRTLSQPAYSKVQARQKTFSSLKIESERLTLIPQDNGTEVLAWEYYGTYKDLKYFVYIDAMTGEEINVLRVIDSDDGALVM